MKAEKQELIALDEVRLLFDYSEEGKGLVWRIKPARCIGVGDRAGTKNKDGYMVVCIKRKFFLVHRLLWLHQTGSLPLGQIDHMNGVRDDNRIGNLRDVSARMNQHNRRKAQKGSVSGLIGVQKRANGTYQAKIKNQGKYMALGTFKTAEEAHARYLAVKSVVHEGYVP